MEFSKRVLQGYHYGTVQGHQERKPMKQVYINTEIEEEFESQLQFRCWLSYIGLA